MAIRFRMDSNADAFAQRLEHATKRRLPGDVAFALTKALVSVRDREVMSAYDGFFTKRNKNFPRIVHTVAAADFNFARQTGVAVGAIKRYDAPRPPGVTTSMAGQRVGKRPASTDFMEKHVRGGTKTARNKYGVAVPTEKNINRKKAGAKAGAPTPAFEPKNMLTKPKYFTVKSKRTGRELIVSRQSRKKRYPLKVYYSFKPFVKIKGGYNPEQAVALGMSRAFEPILRQKMLDTFLYLTRKSGADYKIVRKAP